jgi:dihydroflavonol-4-reductase
MRAFVTGSSGFIGGRLAAKLAEEGFDVYGLVRKTSRLDGLRKGDIKLVRGDLRDSASLGDGVRDKDYVFHLAGVIRALDWKTYHEVNVIGTRNLLEACRNGTRNLKKFVFVSSISAAGPSHPGHPLSEDDPCRPVSPYGRSKLLAERLVQSYGDDFPITIIRPPNVLGPRQQELWETIKLLGNRLWPTVGSAARQTNLVSVDDLVRALVLAALLPQSAGQTYFVTDGTAYTWTEITDAIAEELGRKKIYFKIPYALEYGIAAVSEIVSRIRGSEPLLTRQNMAAALKYSWVYDSGKIERELGFEPAMDMKETIRWTVAWYRDRGMLKGRRRA